MGKDCHVSCKRIKLLEKVSDAWEDLCDEYVEQLEKADRSWRDVCDEYHKMYKEASQENKDLKKKNSKLILENKDLKEQLEQVERANRSWRDLCDDYDKMSYELILENKDLKEQLEKDNKDQNCIPVDGDWIAVDVEKLEIPRVFRDCNVPLYKEDNDSELFMQSFSVVLDLCRLINYMQEDPECLYLVFDGAALDVVGATYLEKMKHNIVSSSTFIKNLIEEGVL